jgi:hypothetical protein
MATNRRTCLIILAASILLLALPGCAGDGSPPADGQEVSDAPAGDQALPTATRTEVPPTAEPTEPPAPGWGDSVTWLASDAHGDNGLGLDFGGDFDTREVSVGSPEQQALQTGDGEILPSENENDVPDHFMRFRVDDGFLHAGSPTLRVLIEVEYLDVGNDTFNVEYDGDNELGPFGDGRFTPTGFHTKTDSGEIRTAIFWVNDAFFGNRVQNADFRIDDASDGAETILRVTVTRIMPGSELDTALFVNFYHDGDQLTLGQCTTLHWDVQNASDVTLNGDPVDHQGFDYECPETTTTYNLAAWNDSEEREEEITIQVTGYDFSVSCHGAPLVGGEWGFTYRIDYYSAQGLASGPISVGHHRSTGHDIYLPPDKYFTSINQGGFTEWTYTWDQDYDCCRIIIHDNNDANSGNDIFIWCSPGQQWP